MARIGEAVEDLAALLDQGLGHAVADHGRRERHVARGHPLGQRHQVGLEAVVLAGEHVTGAAEAADDLVDDEQHVVLAADPLHLGPVGLGRDDDRAGAHDRLAHEGGDVVRAQLQDLVLDSSGGLEAERLGRQVAAEVVPVGRHNVDEAGQRQVGLGVHLRLAAQAGPQHGAAVIGVVPADEGLLGRLALEVPEMAHHARDGVVGFRARGAVEDVVQARGRHLGQLFGELDRGGRRGLEEGVVVGQLQHLPVGRLGQLLAAVADVDAPQAGHAVDEGVALGVGERHSVGLRDDAAAALLGERLVVGEGVQVVAGIAVAPPGGGVARGQAGHGLRSLSAPALLADGVRKGASPPRTEPAR